MKYFVNNKLINDILAIGKESGNMIGFKINLEMYFTDLGTITLPIYISYPDDLINLSKPNFPEEVNNISWNLQKPKN